MTIQEAIAKEAFESETISKETILKYLASKKMPVDYDDFINNHLFKRPIYTRYWWLFYDKTGNQQINVKDRKRIFDGIGDKQSTGIFDINGILLFDDDIVYHKQTNLFYIVKKREGNTYLCREGYPSRRYGTKYSLEDLAASQDFKFVAAYDDEIRFHDRYISLSDTIKTIY